MSYHHRQHCLLLRMRYCIRPVSFTYKNKMKIHDSFKKNYRDKKLSRC